MKDYKTEISGIVKEIKNKIIDDEDVQFNQWVKNQQQGDCQQIASTISFHFLKVKHIVGEIDIGTETIFHHWNEYEENIIDFGKGTIHSIAEKEKIEINAFDPLCEGDLIYRKGYKK